MSKRTMVRFVGLAALVLLGAAATPSLRVEAAGGNHCAKGIQPCSAKHVGEPCNPNDANIVCSAQADGSFCCLALAP